MWVMATLTVAGVDDALRELAGSPNAPPAEFIKELNLALPRLYDLGMWRDLLFEHVVTTSSSTFTIPSNAESLISAIVDYDSSTVATRLDMCDKIRAMVQNLDQGE